LKLKVAVKNRNKVLVEKEAAEGNNNFYHRGEGGGEFFTSFTTGC